MHGDLHLFFITLGDRRATPVMYLDHELGGAFARVTEISHKHHRHVVHEVHRIVPNDRRPRRFLADKAVCNGFRGGYRHVLILSPR